MDEGAGRILAALHELDLEDNTIVLFTSDNGPEVSYIQYISNYDIII